MVRIYSGNLIPDNWQEICEGYAIENNIGFWEAYSILEQHLMLTANIEAEVR